VGTVVQASPLVASARRYSCGCEFGDGKEGDADEGGRGEDDCGGLVATAGKRIISSCSKVVASTDVQQRRGGR
jgi:hypothetical protein